MKEFIFDPVRKKRVVLTPEEGVRQWLIKELSDRYGYPVHMMSCEHTLMIDNMSYRGDLVVFNKRKEPVIIAECKAPQIKITKESFMQAFRYNMALKVKYIIVTNGKNTYVTFFDNKEDTHSFVKDIPHYNEFS